MIPGNRGKRCKLAVTENLAMYLPGCQLVGLTEGLSGKCCDTKYLCQRRPVGSSNTLAGTVKPAWLLSIFCVTVYTRATSVTETSIVGLLAPRAEGVHDLN